nr:hypothetical protein [Tanacetum cinerariifolium]
MSLTFADTHNMVAYLNKSDASKYALTVNPTIYITCIKQLWNIVVIKQSNDVTRLQALVDRKKVVITEAVIRDVLHLDDADGVDCLPNEEIFVELDRMGRQFNFSKYIFESLVRNVNSSSKFYMYPRVGKGFLGVEMPLFEGMLVAGEPEEQGDDVQDQSIPSLTPPTPPPQQPQDLPSTSQEALDACAALTRRVENLEHDKVAQALEITKLKKMVKKLERVNKGRMIADLDRDTDVALVDDEGTEKKAEDAHVAGDEQVKRRQAEIYQIDMDHASKVLSMQEDEPEVQETVDVVTTAKLIIEVVAAVRVVIRDPEEESTAIIPAETKSKDKGKGIMVEEPKPIKKKQQVKMDEEYARMLHEELKKDIDWSVAIDYVKQKAKEDSYVQRYQNVAGLRLDYFKGMSYDDIRPIFEAKFNSNITFLLKSKEQIGEEENIAIESINETLAQKAAKRRKLNEEVKDLKQHLEIVPDEDDDVYTEATPLARKVPIVDYQITQLNNKPRYKIIRADGTQLYVSFITLLKNFDREDLESLWSIVKEIFSTSKPNNFSDDYLLTTLRAMFERPDG